jgi:hypothetical protein
VSRTKPPTKGMNLPAASNTRYKTNTGADSSVSTVELHRRFMADYGVLCVISVRRFKEDRPHLGCCLSEV